MRHNIPQVTLHLIYQGLNSLISMSGSCGITLRIKLQKLENRAARDITFSDCDTAYFGYLLELLTWLNLTRLNEIDRATMVYKSSHWLVSEYLCSSSTTRVLAFNLKRIAIKSYDISTFRSLFSSGVKIVQIRFSWFLVNI